MLNLNGGFMNRMSSSLKAGIFLFAALLAAPRPAPLAAQEPAAVSQAASPAGPRVSASLRPVEPRFANSAPAMYKETHTIVISTLVLVLCVVILVLLIA